MISETSSNSRICRWPVLVAALGLGWLGCTIDDPQVGAIGAVSLLTVDPAIVPQAVILAPPGTVTSNRVQTMLWTLTRADLTVPGASEPYDLLFADDPRCQAIDSPSRITLNFGTCVDNLVVHSAAEIAEVRADLILEFKLRLKRVVPIVLPFIGDEDMDGILNGNDNCILVANPGQEDSGDLGIGNACRVVDFFSGIRLDSDADGVADTADNCVHRINPDQANPPTPGEFAMLESIVSDGIGFACEDNALNPTPYKEQVIDIPLDSVARTFDFILPNAQGFVLVDFSDDAVFPNCEWDMGTCSGFDKNAIQVCIRTNAFEVIQGCS